jgi:AraC family transcriptional regulator of adaptative response / DNA-3-methyladenine glycosylase II
MAQRGDAHGWLSFQRLLRPRLPFDAAGIIEFLSRRAVPGVEEAMPGGFRRSLRLAHGPAVIDLLPAGPAGQVRVRVLLADERNLDDALARSRLLLDLEHDASACDSVLVRDPLLGERVRARPGARVPGTPDGGELAVRAILGQQVSLRGAATLAARLTLACGERLPAPVGAVTHLFPAPAALARLDPQMLAMPWGRRRAVLALANALADGLALDPGGDLQQARAALLAIPGIGEWTADYVAMRAPRDADAFLATDLGVHHALERLGCDARPAAARAIAEAWRPFRAYAVIRLWAILSERDAVRSNAAGRPSRGRAGGA